MSTGLTYHSFYDNISYIRYAEVNTYGDICEFISRMFFGKMLVLLVINAGFGAVKLAGIVFRRQ